MDTVSNKIVDTSYTRVIIIDKKVSNNAMDILPNTSMDTISNNIVDTSYTSFIIIDREIYILQCYGHTTKHINGHCIKPFCGHKFYKIHHN